MARRSAAVTLKWADGEHTFRLGIKELEELQEKCDAGPAWIYGRLANDQWRVADVRETIRLGLIGAGMKPVPADKYCRRYVDEQPLSDSVPITMAILQAVLEGVPDEPPKGDGEAATSKPSPTSPEGKSGSSASTNGVELSV